MGRIDLFCARRRDVTLDLQHWSERQIDCDTRRFSFPKSLRRCAHLTRPNMVRTVKLKEALDGDYVAAKATSADERRQTAIDDAWLGVPRPSSRFREAERLCGH